ncbi:MAG: hypothetical protein P8J20_15585 [Novosphingobium sp.]|nr:hypothetical protein [Novosphingobium sp.]
MADPSQMTVVRSDAKSWDVKITDPQGVSHVDVEYGTLPNIFTWREIEPNCPKTMQITVSKQRKFFFRTMPFYNVVVCDCSRLDNGAFLVTHFNIAENDKVSAKPAHERTPDEQRLLDATDIVILNQEWHRLRMRLILLLLLLLLLLGIWGTLGPLWGD